MILNNIRVQQIIDIDDNGYVRMGISSGTFAWRLGSESGSLVIRNNTSQPYSGTGTAVLTFSAANAATFSGTVQLPNGTFSAPALNFASATASGFYRANTNSIGITNNGIASGYIDGISGSGGLFIASLGAGITLSPAGSNGITLGNSSNITTVGGNLTVSGTGVSTFAKTVQITGFTNPVSGTGIELGHDGTEGLVQSFNRTGATATPLWLGGNSIIIKTGSGAATTAATFDSSQNTTLAGTLNVSGTGTSSIGGSLNIIGASIFQNSATDAFIQLSRASTARSSQVQFQTAGVNDWQVYTTSSSPDIRFYNGTDRFKLNSTYADFTGITTVGTSTTAASILGVSLGLTGALWTSTLNVVGQTTSTGQIAANTAFVNASAQFLAKSSNVSGTDGVSSIFLAQAQPGYNTYFGTTADGTIGTYRTQFGSAVINNQQGFLLSSASNGLLLHAINGSFVLATGNTGAARLTISTSAVTFDSSVTIGINNTTASTLTTNGALVVSGGVGVAGTVNAPQFSGRGVAASSNSPYIGGAWLLNGLYFTTPGSVTATDSSSSGTIASVAMSVLNVPTIATSSVTTYTDAANLYIAGGPNTGTNATIANSWGLWNAGKTRLDGNALIKGQLNIGQGSNDQFVIAPQAAGGGVILSNLNAAGGSYTTLVWDALSFVFRLSGTPAITINGSLLTTFAGSIVVSGTANQFAGQTGFGGAPTTASAIRVLGSATVGTTQAGGDFQATFTSTATTAGNGVSSIVQTQAASFTMASAYAFHALNASVGAGSAITTQYGFYADAMTSAGTNYAIFTNAGLVKFGDTTSGTSTTAAAILGKSLGLTENLFVGGTGTYSNILSVVSNTSASAIMQINQTASGANGAAFIFQQVGSETGRIFSGFGANGITVRGAPGTANNDLFVGPTATTISATAEATTGGAGSLTTAGGIYAAKSGVFGLSILSIGPTSGVGYGTGAGGTITQGTNRTTGVTLNKVCGQITLVSAAGTASWQTFTVTNSTVAATDVIRVNQASGTDLYQIMVTNVSAGSFKISYATTGGTSTEQPVFNFAIIKAVTS